MRSDAVMPTGHENANVFQRLRMHPPGFWFIFWGELAERSSFYGMRTILALYLTTVLAYDQSHGAMIMQAFIAACYIAPLFGGFLADRVLGRYRTILYFAVPYIIGHLVLGGIETRPAMFFALFLLALGSGSIKPNTSTLMGQMYEEQKKSFLLTEAFSYFYAAINIGSFLSTAALPLVRDHWAKAHGIRAGYAVALMIPAALMAVSFVFFAIGKRFYPQEDLRALRNQPPKSPEQKKAERETLARIAGIFGLITLFWLVYDQSASTWIYFAKDHCDLTVFGSWKTTPDQIQALNPFLIVILTPIFNAIWESWKKRRGREVPDTRKMLIGFFIVIGCMATMATAAFLAGETGKVTVWWVMVATFVITLSELCVSVVGLEFAYRMAAPGTKSVVTAAFLFTVFVGDLLGLGIDSLYKNGLEPGPYFAVQTAIMVAAAIVFWFVARKFERGEANSPGLAAGA